ncbi:MAG: hypothetical protein JNL79_27310 [Myxococcales bacterium]|nr:hypothetical protein [Myxococcales bacterium]
MAHPVVILFLVHQGEAGLPATLAMTTATEKALGPGAQVVVREVDLFPSDESVEKEADVVAEVTWTSKPLAAHLHVHAKPGWLDRDIGFADTDSPSDRGRTVGFVVASMVPEFEPVVLAPPPPPPPPFVTAPVLAPRDPGVTAPPRVNRFVVDAFGAMSSGMGGSVGVGGGAAIGVRASPWLSVHVASDLRLGEIEGFGRTTAFRLGAGVTLTPASWGILTVGLRVDVAALRLGVARTTTSSDNKSRWLPDVAVLGELSTRLGGDASLFGAIGPDFALGTTTVALNGTSVSVLPRARVTGELGLRVRF